MTKRSRELSKIDRRILHSLQKNGRISYTDLSKEVGLSVTPCIERIKRLEKDNVIEGFTALINPEFLDAALVVFVQIRLNRTSQDNFNDFRQAVVELEEVQECYLVSGNFDYLIKARVADMPAYRTFLGDTLLKLPGVQESTSYVVMEELKETLEIPIHYNPTR